MFPVSFFCSLPSLSIADRHYHDFYYISSFFILRIPMNLCLKIQFTCVCCDQTHYSVIFGLFPVWGYQKQFCPEQFYNVPWYKCVVFLGIKKYKGSDIIPCLQTNKLAYQNFMSASRRYGIPGSKRASYYSQQLSSQTANIHAGSLSLHSHRVTQREPDTGT